jgi:hypothetical protein
MEDVPIAGFRKYWTKTPLASLKSQCHAITNKCLVQQVRKIPNDIETLARCTRAKVREISECASVVNSAKENRANFIKV